MKPDQPTKCPKCSRYLVFVERGSDWVAVCGQCTPVTDVATRRLCALLEPLTHPTAEKQ